MKAVNKGTSPRSINYDALEDKYKLVLTGTRGTVLDFAHKLNYFVQSKRESPDMFAMEDLSPGDDTAETEMARRRRLLDSSPR